MELKGDDERWGRARPVNAVNPFNGIEREVEGFQDGSYHALNPFNGIERVLASTCSPYSTAAFLTNPFNGIERRGFHATSVPSPPGVCFHGIHSMELKEPVETRRVRVW